MREYRMLETTPEVRSYVWPSNAEARLSRAEARLSRAEARLSRAEARLSRGWGDDMFEP